MPKSQPGRRRRDWPAASTPAGTGGAGCSQRGTPGAEGARRRFAREEVARQGIALRPTWADRGQLGANGRMNEWAAQGERAGKSVRQRQREAQCAGAPLPTAGCPQGVTIRNSFPAPRSPRLWDKLSETHGSRKLGRPRSLPPGASH